MRAVGRQTPVVLRAERLGPGGDCQWQRDVFCGGRIAGQCRRAAAVIAPARRSSRNCWRPDIRPRSSASFLMASPAPHGGRWRRGWQPAALLAEANQELQLPDAAPLAVYLGRLEPNCGLERLLEAWTLILHRWPNARLWLIGEGSMRRALARHSEARNLTGRVSVVGPFDEVDALLAAADVFLRPTSEPGSGVGLLEAFAAGLPVVASDIPGHREWIKGEQDGLLHRRSRLLGDRHQPLAGESGVGREAGPGRPAESRRTFACQHGRHAPNIVPRVAVMTKRILQIIPTLDRAGAEKQLCLLAEGLPATSSTSTFARSPAAGRWRPDWPRPGFRRCSSASGWRLDPQAFWQLRSTWPGCSPTWCTPGCSPPTPMASRPRGSAASSNSWPATLRRSVEEPPATGLRRRSWPGVPPGGGQQRGRARFLRRPRHAGRTVRVIPNGVALPEPPAMTRRQLLAELDLPA